MTSNIINYNLKIIFKKLLHNSIFMKHVRCNSSQMELTFVWPQQYCHCTYTHLPHNHTLHHMKCHERMRRWWNSFMCCLRHHAFDQIPSPSRLPPLAPPLRSRIPAEVGRKWTNKWDWVCWPYFVTPPPWILTCGGRRGGLKTMLSAQHRISASLCVWRVNKSALFCRSGKKLNS